MKINGIRSGVAVIAVALLLSSAANSQAAVIFPANNGFETPDLGSGGGAYAYNPGGASWSFGGGGGIAANGSAFNVSNATNGNSDATISTSGQAGVVQGGDGTLAGTYISQILSGFADGTASVTFDIESRPGYDGPNAVNVKLDNIDLGTYLADSTSAFNTITTPTVSISAGSHTLYFIGTVSTGDHTSFIDNVSVENTPTPEPATMVIWGVGALGMGLVAARRRKLAAK